MELTAEISQAWGWAGIKPLEIVGENDFGNFIIKDVNGSYWRLCPEDLYCQVIAQDRAALDARSTNQDFLQDWYMSGLVAQARERLGALRPGYKYCLKIHGGVRWRVRRGKSSLHSRKGASFFLWSHRKGN